MEYIDKRKYIGNVNQLFEVKEYRLSGGRTDGLRGVDVDNGSGLCFTVLPDRCMDFGKVTFKGNNVSYISPCGYVHPSYYESFGSEWLRSFTAGLLTTCGFNNIGSGCVDNGDTLGVHGRLSNLPAEQYGISIEDTSDGPAVHMHGVMRHSAIFAESLLLTRDIYCTYGKNVITFKDRVENIGFKTVPLMRLYHFNFGYPLIDEDAKLYIPSCEVLPRNAHAKEDEANWNKLSKPIKDFEERCYYHKLNENSQHRSMAGVYNSKLSYGAYIEFDRSGFDHFIEWKMMGEGDYVLGLEPGNAPVDGRDKAREDNVLKFIEPGRVYENTFNIHFVASDDENDKLIKTIGIH